MHSQTLDSSDLNGRPIRLTRRGVALLIAGCVVAVAGEVLGSTELRFFGLAMLALPLVMVLLKCIVPPRLEVTRTVYPTTVAAGDRLRVVTELRNTSVFGVEPSSYADIVTGADRSHVGGVLPAIATRMHPREGRRRRRIAYSLNRMRRGVRQVGPLLYENIDGLGLTRRVHRLGEITPIEVWPQVHDVDAFEIPALRSGREIEVSLGRGGEADDVITREYRHGDPLRRVHWKATARSGELRIRQEEHHSEAVGMLILDTSDCGDVLHDDAFELSVSVAASVITRLHALGFDTELCGTQETEDIEGDSLEDLRVTATAPLDLLMRKLMLLHWAKPDASSQVDAIEARVARTGNGPLVYVGRGFDDEAIELAGYGNPAIAVICADSPNFDEANEAAYAFQQAGWDVIVMNAAARDPWAKLRRMEASA
ncbi:DUF58 domain-containing protein [Gulosibacter bifidus]|uniref:DUF58 domain-containing protein n=1 Tax=Gulosibacter bifidus TaxID=272239 RepID=A0ABW5RIE6_9MICO|nr:DUF58 domain-containing protein [Gulosibacter bifidus]